MIQLQCEEWVFLVIMEVIIKVPLIIGQGQLNWGMKMRKICIDREKALNQTRGRQFISGKRLQLAVTVQRYTILDLLNWRLEIRIEQRSILLLPPALDMILR